MAPLVAVALAACSSTAPIPASIPTPTRSPISAVPWLPLPRGNVYQTFPSPSPPVPIPAGTAVCTAAQIEGRLADFGAVRLPNASIALRNTGSAPCYMNGVPDLTIVDAQGSVLVSLAGGAETGTQFDQYVAAVDVLMAVGTPALADADGIIASVRPPGQAFLNVKWTGCAPRSASQLWVGLPSGSGRVVVDFPLAAADPATCTNEAPLVVDPLKPTGVEWPPAPDYLNVDFSTDAPDSVKRGSTLHFYVTIEDHDSRDFVLSPCPDYAEALVNGPVVYYGLNCGPVGVVKAGRSVTFEMKFEIPSSTRQGPWTLLWALVGSLTKPGGIQQPITIT